MIKYPRILIIGQSFNLQSGGGITLYNLFYGWDKKSIAVASAYIVNPNFDVCENYYQLGSLEYPSRFPFNLNPRPHNLKSGVIKKKETSGSDGHTIKNRIPVIKILYENALSLTGLRHFKRKFKFSDKFFRWIKEFSPDLIYAQLASLEEIRLVSYLKRELDLPLAIHVMDDWPSTIGKGYFPRLIWGKIIDREFTDLLSKSKFLFSISDAMSEEYLKRYSLQFIPFHNPIETALWTPHFKKSFVIEKEYVTILYSGRIGIGISESLLEVATAIDSIKKFEFQIKFHIQTPLKEHSVLGLLKKFKCVVINPVVNYDKIPEIYSKADILLLANDFNIKSAAYLRLSMPTKASEYMISGTPVLVYAPGESAVSRFFYQNECGYCVRYQSKEEIINAIEFLVANEEYRKRISSNAVHLAKERFDSKKIRQDFLNIFQNLFDR